MERSGCGDRLALGGRQARERPQSLCSQLQVVRRRGGHGGRQHLAHLADVEVGSPEAFQGRDQADHPRVVPRPARVLERHPKVGQPRLELREPVGGVPARELLGGARNEVVKPRVSLPARLFELVRVELLERELANGTEHHETRLRAAVCPTEERGGDERLQILDRRAEAHERRARREPALEHCEAPVQRAVLGRKDLVAPRQGRCERALPFRKVVGARGAEPDVDLRRQVVHGEHPSPRGDDLDREREAVEVAAELAHDLLVGLVEPETTVGRAGALDEQLDGRVFVERVDDQDALVREMERRAARAQDDEAARPLDELRHERRRRRQVLEVVEDEQELPVAEVVVQRGLDVPLVLEPE